MKRLKRFKNGGYITDIAMNVFGVTIFIVITEEPNIFVDKSNLRMWTSEDPEEDLRKYCDAFTFQKQKAEYYIILAPKCDVDQCCHESIHCMSRIFRDRNIKADYNNDEIFAYYTGWVTQTVCNHLFQSKEQMKVDKKKVNKKIHGCI